MLLLSKIWTRYVCGMVVFLAMSANTSFVASILNEIEKSTCNDVLSDPYIQKFMNRYGGDCVGYSNNKLVLYADPSAGRLVLLFAGALLFGGCSLVCLDGTSRGDGMLLGMIGLGIRPYRHLI
jgi:hypothetical protein